uniref:Dihydrolipoamide acetyltransferase component of pyruvate dehydrogenase complex n=1 Tax=Plectus sambesii TaxID=2011161 RepID=A0A914VYY6_9BILA
MFSRALAVSSIRRLHGSAVLTAQAIRMPSLSPTMESGTIVKWVKKEGDEVGPGDVLCEIQTDKAVVAMETDEEGVLAKILVKEDVPDVTIGRIIAVMAEAGEDWKSVKVPEEGKGESKPAKKAESKTENKAESKKPSPAQSKPSEKPQKETAPAHSTDGQKTSLLGPAVKLMMQHYGIERDVVKGSGPKGTIVKGDLLNYIKSKNLSPEPQTAEPPTSKDDKPKKPAKPTPAPGTTYVDIPLSNMRKTIAKRLTQSKTTIPHAYLGISVNLRTVSQLRSRLKADGIPVSVNDFVIKSVAHALRIVPEVNVQFIKDAVVPQKSVDVSVAVATESGLITPIVPNADRLGVSEISSKIKELVGKAKQNKLQLNEFQGGTFTVSNLGMYGISHFTAIINPPQAAIMAVGGAEDYLTPDMSAEKIMRVTLCFDNRAISETHAAQFLSEFQAAFEDADVLLFGASTANLAALL